MFTFDLLQRAVRYALPAAGVVASYVSPPPERVETEPPLPVYHYRVDVGAASLAFSEVAGLQEALDTRSSRKSRPPGQPLLVQLTFRKGVVASKSVAVFYNWVNSTALNKVKKKDLMVHLCDEKGVSLVRWKVVEAFLVKLDAPTFSATANEVPIESLQLVASRLEISAP